LQEDAPTSLAASPLLSLVLRPFAYFVILPNDIISLIQSVNAFMDSIRIQIINANKYAVTVVYFKTNAMMEILIMAMDAPRLVSMRIISSATTAQKHINPNAYM
jgi:hypothetical protein